MKTLSIWDKLMKFFQEFDMKENNGSTNTLYIGRNGRR